MSVLDIIGGLFDSKQQRQGEKNILSQYRQAQQTGLDAQNEARNSRYVFNAPWQEGGLNAFNRNQQMQTPGFQYSPSDPSYAWRVGEGINALDRSAASRGSLMSDGTLKALTRYGQDMASQEFNNDFSRNNILAGYGQHAVDNLDDAQRDWASGYGNILFNAANGMKDAYRGKADADSATAGSIFGGIKQIGQDLMGYF